MADALTELIAEPPHYPCCCAKVGADNASVTFSTCLGSRYTSINYHRNHSGQGRKSAWSVSREYECETFCVAELGTWTDSSGNYWSLREDCQVVLGTQNQRVAFFGNRSNDADPWHGYPVSGRASVLEPRRVPDEVIERWFSEKVISRATRKRLLTGRL